MIVSTHGDRYEDDGILFEAIDFEQTRLRVRVGPVFNGDIPHPEKGVWIELGETEFLMSQATFFALTDHIHRRFDEWKRFQDIVMKEDI